MANAVRKDIAAISAMGFSLGRKQMAPDLPRRRVAGPPFAGRQEVAPRRFVQAITSPSRMASTPPSAAAICSPSASKRRMMLPLRETKRQRPCSRWQRARKAVVFDVEEPVWVIETAPCAKLARSTEREEGPSPALLNQDLPLATVSLAAA